MSNEMRDRLVELIWSSVYEFDKRKPNGREFFGEWCADHLIENGVIVPPCKVGDTLYSTELNFVCERKIDEVEIFLKSHKFGGNWWAGDSKKFGKTVFRTKDQAEQKLKEMRGE